jgi:hypothetical protein
MDILESPEDLEIVYFLFPDVKRVNSLHVKILCVQS